jgi:hypothetical protein
LVKTRKIFEPTPIYATSGAHSLLVNGRMQVIGYVSDTLRYTSGGCVVPTVVSMHYGVTDNEPDRFYFEDGTIAYASVNINRQDYITDFYTRIATKLASNEGISAPHFVDMVTEIFVFNEMGF